MADFEFLEHTADIRVAARGKDIPELFQNAARGMMSYIFGPGVLGEPPDSFERISIASIDQISLLVDWLSKLLLLSQLNRSACVSFKFISLTDTALVADVGLKSTQALEEVKAVTYYDLDITRDKSGYLTIVTLDI